MGTPSTAGLPGKRVYGLCSAKPWPSLHRVVHSGPMRKGVLIALCFLVLDFGQAEVCGDPPRRESRLEVGLAVENLVPSKLPNFEASLPAYGIVAGIPLGENAIELEVLYGSSPGASAKLFEAAYRLNLTTPHLNGFALAGAHLLSYTTPGPDQNFVGGFLGLGATISMAERFAIDALLKMYFQTRPMLAVGGSFRVTL